MLILFVCNYRMYCTALHRKQTKAKPTSYQIDSSHSLTIRLIPPKA